MWKCMTTKGSTTSGAEKSRGGDEGKDPTEGGIIKEGRTRAHGLPSTLRTLKVTINMSHQGQMPSEGKTQHPESTINTAHHIYPKQDNIRRNPRHQSNLTG